MNQERAREIAREAFIKWQDAGENGLLEDALADALHAAYEADAESSRAQTGCVSTGTARCLKCNADFPNIGSLEAHLAENHGGPFVPFDQLKSELRSAARLASIKETARMLFASGRVVLVNSAFDQAEHFEETFERRYGGKP